MRRRTDWGDFPTPEFVSGKSDDGPLRRRTLAGSGQRGQSGCYGDSASSRAFTSSRARSPALDSQDSMVQNIARVAVAMASVANQPRSFHGVGRTRSFMSSGLEAATMTTIMIGTEITALITADQ